MKINASALVALACAHLVFGHTSEAPSHSGDHDHHHEHASSVTTVKIAETLTACSAHGDHWHCPPGVPEPTTPPTALHHSHSNNYTITTATAAVTIAPVSQPHSHSEDNGGHSYPTAGGCVAHGDHWHCPTGVPVPTTPPPTAASTGNNTKPAATGAAVLLNTPNAGKSMAGLVAVLLGLVM